MLALSLTARPKRIFALTIKQKNVPIIGSIIFLNCVFVYVFVLGNSLDLGKFSKNFIQVIITPAITFFALITSSIISSKLKFKIIYVFLGEYCPGCFAFSKYAKDDYRINEVILKNIYGDFPSTHKEENILFYKIYKKFENDRIVYSSQQNFLLFRELFFVHLFFMLGLVSYISLNPTIHYNVWPLALLAGELILFWLAARILGIAFVKNVLAIACSTGEK